MVCSGPTVTTKFIHASGQGLSTDHGASHSLVSVTRSNGSHLTAVEAERQRFVGLLPRPRKYPTTVADRVTIRLISTIERDPIGDILHNANYLKTLPQRLGVSPALRDCVALFCHCWTNYRCPEAMEKSPVFHDLHGKALRSLMRALQNPDTQLSIETCSAVTVMARCNLLFDGGDPTLHQKGIAKMMRSKGPPPQNGDDLHVQLSIANGGHIVRHWAAAHCTEDPQWISSWQDVLGWKASTEVPEHVNKHWQDQLNTITTQWAMMVKCIKEINNPYTPADRRQHLAEQTHALALRSLAETETGYRLCVSTYEIGMEMESSLGENYPWHRKLASPPPSHEALLKPLAAYVPMRIIFSRIAYDLSCTLGATDAEMYGKYHWMCQQGWDLLPHIMKIDHPIATLNYVVGVVLCFEILESQERKDYLVDALKSTNFRRVLPSSREDTERFLMNICCLSTGRDTDGYDVHVN